MAHPEQFNFIHSVRERYPGLFRGTSVLDVGSWDVNGNNRPHFEDVEYTGVDIVDGKNVDIVTPIHLYKTEGTYDVVISSECLEHDMHYKESLARMAELTKGGGLLVFTCATTGRREHGTLRSLPGDSLTTKLPEFLNPEWPNYYKNITEEHVREVWDVETLFSKYEFSVNTGACDLYFWGLKK